MQGISHFKIIILLISVLLIVIMKKTSMSIQPMAELEYQQRIVQINNKMEELQADTTPSHASQPTAKPKKKKRKNHN